MEWVIANWQWVAGLAAVAYAVYSWRKGTTTVAPDAVTPVIGDREIINAYLIILSQARQVADEGARKVLVESLVNLLMARTQPPPVKTAVPAATVDASAVQRLIEVLGGGK